MKQLSGTGVALVTPFNEDFSLDLPALRNLVRHVSRPGGVDFLVVLGTTGESATLSAEEQDTVIRTVFEENAGKLPIVIGCGGNNTAAVAAKARKLESEWHPAAFLSVCPYYNKPTQEGLFLHFREVCSAVPDTAVILYNVPGRTASNLLPDTAIRIANACPNAISIKEASGSIEQMMDILNRKPSHFELLSGDDNLTLPVIAAGGTGVVSVAANALPVEFSMIARLAMAGNYEAARRAHYRILNLMQLNFAEGNPASVKAMLKLLGICEPYVRLPLAPASAKLAQTMQAELEKAQIAIPARAV